MINLHEKYGTGLGSNVRPLDLQLDSLQTVNKNECDLTDIGIMEFLFRPQFLLS